MKSLPLSLSHGTLGTRQQLMNGDAGSRAVGESRAAELYLENQAKRSSGESSNGAQGRN